MVYSVQFGFTANPLGALYNRMVGHALYVYSSSSAPADSHAAQR
jgi:hypothetical protein